MIPLLTRLGKWLVSNPLFGVIAALLAALGTAKLRQRHLETRAATAQATADKARMALRRAAAEAEAAKLAGLEVEQLKLRQKATEADTAAAGEAKAEGQALKDIARRWPTK